MFILSSQISLSYPSHKVNKTEQQGLTPIAEIGNTIMC